MMYGSLGASPGVVNVAVNLKGIRYGQVRTMRVEEMIKKRLDLKLIRATPWLWYYHTSQIEEELVRRFPEQSDSTDPEPF